jgi:hypothetical protein
MTNNSDDKPSSGDYDYDYGLIQSKSTEIPLSSDSLLKSSNGSVFDQFLE